MKHGLKNYNSHDTGSELITYANVLVNTHSMECMNIYESNENCLTCLYLFICILLRRLGCC